MATALGCGNDANAPTEPALATPSAVPESAASNTWVTRADMPSDRWNLTTAAVPNASGQWMLYAIGGSNSSNGIVKMVQAYNVATNTWTRKASLPVPLYWTNGAGVINGKIYVSGGSSANGHYRPDLYVYDPATNAWTRKHDMPIMSYRGVTGVMNNRLYVLTGCANASCTPYTSMAFYRYDPSTDQWTRLANPHYAHDWSAGGVMGGRFYVADSHVEMYDPATNQWTTRASMPQACYAGAGVAWGSRLYVMGGFQGMMGGGMMGRTTSVYNSSTNGWGTMTPMPTARGRIAGSQIMLNGMARLQVIGGSRPGNNLQYIP
jgi:N-acetylneuraminic acid mutarotase